MDREDRDLFPAEPEMTAQRRHRRRTGVPESPAFPAREESVPESPENAAPEAEGPVTETPAEKPAAPEEPEQAAPETEAPANPAREAGSRVPAEARRMTAAPYGVRGPEARRPGTRPMVAPKRPPVETERKPVPRPQRPRPDSVGVGYAPGRMKDGMTRQMPAANGVRQEPAARDGRREEAWSSPESRFPVNSRSARDYLERRGQPLRNMRPEEAAAPVRKAGAGLRLVIIALLLLGAALASLLALNGGGGAKTPRVYGFIDSNPQDLIAPADVVFSATTGKEVAAVRLVDEDGKDVPVEIVVADNADGKLWGITLHVENGFDGQVRLEAQRESEEQWYPTEFTSQVSVRSVPVVTPEAATQAPAPETPETEAPETAAPDTDGTGTEASGNGTAEATPAPGENGPEPDGETEEEEEAWEGGDELHPIREDSDTGDEFREVGELKTAPPTPTPAPEEEEKPTETPPLTVEAAPEANPDLITNVTVYTGNSSKKIKDYSRPAKELIHMPVASEYTPRKLGVLTFRGDNFRTNAACGNLETPAQELRTVWREEGGSSRGVNQTYYGYAWPGQPAIVKWSKQIRTSGNIYDSKMEKENLKEVIIAGMDGAVRFFDLDDGSLTRNSIKLGYPLRGTPSLHTYYEPFMTVGQFARKMKVKTGKIGLRQYNLYNSKELRLIDGLDGRSHRPLNDVGSFETSALVDRVSDTVIAAGSNGVLYLEALNSTFDWKMGVMSISPSITMMTSKTKSQKAAQTAVESSLAAYDRYVFYGDMGGILRCVDTNLLAPVWAVDTGDAIMASVAMDLTEERELNLYTANMLANRKKGNGEIQIRRYDALSGREIWCTEIGVFKGKKDKDDVGAKASPVIGQNSLSSLVYFTVTGLSEDGRAALGLKGEEKAALVALDKGTGGRVWVHGLDSRAESSPVAVYDADGNGWIIQCAQDGTIDLLEGLTGKTVNTLKIEGEIEASPAVFDDMMVLGTTGKGTSFIYGIRIAGAGTPSEEEIRDAREAAENAEPSGQTPAPEAEGEAEEEDGGEADEGDAGDAGEEEWNDGEDWDNVPEEGEGASEG